MRFKIFLTITLVSFVVFGCRSETKMKQGNEVIAKVEKFKSENGKLPNSLREIGIAETESGPIYYRKESESKFIVWFGKELGESMSYDSDTKQWK